MSSSTAHIREGITTEEIDKWVYDLTTAAHAVPAPLHGDAVAYLVVDGSTYAFGIAFVVQGRRNGMGCEIYTDKADGWSVYTADGKPSAQWEIQVLVTETGYEILWKAPLAGFPLRLPQASFFRGKPLQCSTCGRSRKSSRCR